MGFLGEIRKLLFGVKSVSKSGAEKAVNYGKEVGEDIIEKGSQVYEKGKDMAEDAFESAGEKLGALKNKAKDMISDISEKVSDNPAVEKAGDFTEGVGNKVMDAGGKAADKAGEFAENVGKKVIEVGGDMAEKAGDFSEQVGEKLMDVKDTLMSKAKELSGKANDKFEETYKKAKELEAQEALEGDSPYADKPIDMGKGLLEDKDDFFAKADKYASGDYKGVKDHTSVNQESVDKTKEIQIGETTITLPSGETKKDLAKAAGFEDLDGDGNEVVDDAIIVEDEASTEAEHLISEVSETVEEKVNETEDLAKAAAEDIKRTTDQKVDDMTKMVDDLLDPDKAE